VGLVGVNGAGKTTQLQLITGTLTPDDGVVLRQSARMRIAYLTQEFDVVPTRTVREEFMSAYSDQLDVLRRTEEVQKELEAMGASSGGGEGEGSGGAVDMDRMGALLDELQELTSAAADLDVSLLDKKVDEMMPELGFGPDDNDRLVASYSGGWQMRMCLGKILLQDPDLLLLDEPTNHLDLGAIEWLETYLRERAGDVPMVVVSHDREFLDRLCTKIVETELGVATSYKGNYSQFVAQKAERAAAQWVAWEKWNKEVARQRDLVDRLAGGAQSGRAAAAEKELERLGLPSERVEKPFVPKKRAFSFPNADHSGQKVLEIDGLRHGYGGRILFDDASLEVEKGERVAVLGPNGAGKSTLLRLVMGREAPEAGKCSLGNHNVVANYFEQNQAEALDGRLTVLETLERAAPDAKLMVKRWFFLLCPVFFFLLLFEAREKTRCGRERKTHPSLSLSSLSLSPLCPQKSNYPHHPKQEIKALLGRMQFAGKAMHKKAEVLSGGEKARLALAKFMLTKGTLLVLDEPTNHLDIPSKEMLEEALLGFSGAVIAVSHDRYFLRRVATRVVAVEGCQLVDYEGDYARFLDKNARERGAMAKKEAQAKEVSQDAIRAKSKMSKAEKMLAKKAKAKEFAAGGKKGGVTKNAKRWS
jgi:ATPase subunit of ABC transporter with duplicated ATPase domains